MALRKGFSTSRRSSHTATGTEAAALPILFIVDDEKEITTTLADQFRRDYRVKVACGADEALTILKRHDVSVIVSDQRMPKKTGSELLAEACMVNPDAVRILLTGYADLDAVVQAVNEGKIFFYLTKPLKTKEIETIVAKAVEHNLLLRDNRRLVEETWLDLTRDIWYKKLTNKKRLKPLRLKDIRMDLQQQPLSIELLQQAFSTIPLAQPLHSRVVSAIIGVPGD